MIPAFSWRNPVDVRFGRGAIEAMAARLGAREAVVLAFGQARGQGLEDRFAAAFGARLAAWVEVPDGLSSMPVLRSLSETVWPLLAEGAGRVLIGVGGGTVLDCAKVLRLRPLSGRFEALAAALRGVDAWPGHAPSTLWLVPTTAGTGSEVTRWATVWDTEADPPRKRSLDELFAFAEAAFVDPSFTLPCSPALTRDTALDALAHALEAIWNRHANPVSDALAISAARRVIANLTACLASPGSITLRTELSLAALEAGLASSQTRTAIAHALSYALTLERGVPHGLACAVWLPTAWKLAAGRDPRVDRLLSQVFGKFDDGSRLAAWLSEVGVDARPAAVGVADAMALVEEALGSVRGRNFIGAAERADA